MRIKSCLEGSGSGKKKKPMIRGPVTCQRCGEKGHRQASYKCPLNGTKKDHHESQGRTVPKHAKLNLQRHSGVSLQIILYMIVLECSQEGDLQCYVERELLVKMMMLDPQLLVALSSVHLQLRRQQQKR